MGHDSHQNKILALGIALIFVVVVAAATMHDADATHDTQHALRVLDTPPVFGGSELRDAPLSIRQAEATGKRSRVQDDR